MSVDVAKPLPHPEGARAKPPSPRWPKRRRRSKPGQSLMAAGEPSLWLTGGALAISIAMILGLLGLVLWSGLGTFWPQPLVMVTLRDGTVRMGEVTREDTYQLSESAVASMKGPIAEEARKRLGEQSSVSAHRRLFRTGNFDLTGDHFNWVSDFAIAPGSESLPEWALVVERIEWGRFYGAPKAFRLRHYRDTSHHQHLQDVQDENEELPGISDEERQLRDIFNFFQANQWRLGGTEAAPKSQEIITALEQDLQEARRESVAKFLNSFQTTDNKRVVAVLENSQQIALDEAQPEQNVREIVEVWPQTEDAWQQYNAWHEKVRQRFRRRKALEKHEIGRVNSGLEDARLAVRQAEIDHDVILLSVARELKNLSLELSDLEEARQQAEETAGLVEARYGEDSPQAEVAGQIAALIQEDIDGRAAPARQRREELEQKLAQTPREAQEAVQRYLRVQEEAREETEAITEQIEAINHENERFQLVMSTVNLENSPAATLPATAAESLNQGELSPDVRQALTDAGLSLGQSVELAGSAEHHRWDITATDSQGGAAIYAVKPQDDALAVYRHKEKSLALGAIVRAYPANQLSGWEEFRVYLTRWWEFLSDDPREANSEGGVFPAIWGTVAMTLIMSILVVPFGVLAALYLREYAKAGPVISAVRIAINNLAGVPSIVFGVFGLGFFCYVLGGWVDGGPEGAGVEPWSFSTWISTFAVLVVIIVVGQRYGIWDLGASGAQRGPWLNVLFGVFWIVMCLSVFGLIVTLVLTTPFFDGFYQARLPQPTFGTTGLIWASLTLALLTLPVVVVATEEALSAVPNSLREGSYACGGSKWQTIRRIVLPHAMPGIMTGMILAMARGAGEVAPLMLVGAVKLAPELPITFSDWSGSIGPVPTGPLHLSRSFMHLGFHIYDLGFQSQNSEAAKPMVFTTTLLLIGIIAFLNLFAVWLRSRLRKRFEGAAF